MRRFLATCLVLAAALCVAAPAALAKDSPKLTEVRGTQFPDRSFVLTLPPGQSVDGGKLDVRENGSPVLDLSVTPADHAGTDKFGAVLVIDASKSMRGRPIEGAMRAARAFARHRNPHQQLAVVMFNRTATTVLPLTTDAAAIDAALEERPKLVSGTHVYDAVAAALDLLKQADVSAGSVIVLSDGSDTGSRAGAARVSAAAKDSGTGIFAVSLRSRTSDPAALAELAARADGEYSAASSAKDLSRIYDELGAQLANEYLIRYRSGVRPQTKVLVAVSVPGFAEPVTRAYISPALGAGTGRVSGKESFWESPLAMLAISLACSLLIALGVLAILALRPRGKQVRERMADFVSPSVTADGKAWGASLTESVFENTERSLEHTRWWADFKLELEIARISMPAVQVVLWTVVATLFATTLMYAVSGSALLSVVGFAVPFVSRALIKRKLDRQRKLFADQLADNLQVIASAMRAGHSFVGALSVAVEDAPEPARTELERVVADERLGVPLEEALNVVVHRMQNRDLEQVVLVAALQRETGGNTAEVIDRVVDTIRERLELRRMVDSLTAQGRLSRWVVTAIPPVLLLFITAINPRYVEPLFHTMLGQAMLVLAATMVVVGSLVIKKIVNVEV